MRFGELNGGLVATGGASLGGFEIAGADGKFAAAQAVIEGEAVVVRGAASVDPVAVRYAWAGWPEGANLANAACLPAAPFKLEVVDGAR
ncbi:MAG: hypothetical protein RLZZ50_288 [Verrucomicrobiota bacterium]